MTIVLDSGGLSMLAGDRGRLAELLRTCDIRPVDELLAREAAALRFNAATDPRPSAVDALVAATADVLNGATILTGDVGDLTALVQHTTHDVVISPV